MERRSLQIVKRALFVSVFVMNSLVSQAFAQEGKTDGDVFADSMQDVYTVAGIGLGGALIGLSTLSFVDVPKDNLKNILVGGAIGIIAGVGVVAWQHASRSRDAYDNYSWRNDSVPDTKIPHNDFSTAERVSWHRQSHDSQVNRLQAQGLVLAADQSTLGAVSRNFPYFAYSFSF